MRTRPTCNGINLRLDVLHALLGDPAHVVTLQELKAPRSFRVLAISGRPLGDLRGQRAERGSRLLRVAGGPPVEYRRRCRLIPPAQSLYIDAGHVVIVRPLSPTQRPPGRIRYKLACSRGSRPFRDLLATGAGGAVGDFNAMPTVLTCIPERWLDTPCSPRSALFAAGRAGMDRCAAQPSPRAVFPLALWRGAVRARRRIAIVQLLLSPARQRLSRRVERRAAGRT